jgi:nuclear transport factor 2 (NTF2) superfamily protein
MQCLRPVYTDKVLTQIICKSGGACRQPLYLLTDEKIKSDQDAWQLVHAYVRRWQIEQSFRFIKAELGMESCRLKFWHNRMKFLQILTLVHAFLLSLLKPELKVKIKTLFSYGCHRIGSGGGKLLHRFTELY